MKKIKKIKILETRLDGWIQQCSLLERIIVQNQLDAETMRTLVKKRKNERNRAIDLAQLWKGKYEEILCMEMSAADIGTIIHKIIELNQAKVHEDEQGTILNYKYNRDTRGETTEGGKDK